MHLYSNYFPGSGMLPASAAPKRAAHLPPAPTGSHARAHAGGHAWGHRQHRLGGPIFFARLHPRAFQPSLRTHGQDRPMPPFHAILISVRISRVLFLLFQAESISLATASHSASQSIFSANSSENSMGTRTAIGLPSEPIGNCIIYLSIPQKITNKLLNIFGG